MNAFWGVRLDWHFFHHYNRGCFERLFSEEVEMIYILHDAVVWPNKNTRISGATFLRCPIRIRKTPILTRSCPFCFSRPQVELIWNYLGIEICFNFFPFHAWVRKSLLRSSFCAKTSSSCVSVFEFFTQIWIQFPIEKNHIKVETYWESSVSLDEEKGSSVQKIQNFRKLLISL